MPNIPFRIEGNNEQMPPRMQRNVAVIFDCRRWIDYGAFTCDAECTMCWNWILI